MVAWPGAARFLDVQPPIHEARPMLDAIHQYAIDGSLLGLFMLAACGGGVLLEHPGSPVRRAIPGALARRALMGLLMGATAIVLIASPWGRRSGAHMNPATTITFLALGKIAPIDAAGYILAQLLGGLAGVLLARAALGASVAHPSVRFVATRPGTPGRRGRILAFAGELLIAFIMMTMVLNASNDAVLARFTGLFAGGLVFAFITLEAPVSGMSLNPARTLASAIPARSFDGLWIYVTAPVLGMLAAAGVYVAAHGIADVRCAKLLHGDGPCFFGCDGVR